MQDCRELVSTVLVPLSTLEGLCGSVEGEFHDPGFVFGCQAVSVVSVAARFPIAPDVTQDPSCTLSEAFVLFLDAPATTCTQTSHSRPASALLPWQCRRQSWVHAYELVARLR